MPAFLEAALKKEYPGEPAAPYKIMNRIGAMRGNKETAKGRAMAAKHQRDMTSKKKTTMGAMMRQKEYSDG